MYKRQDIVRKAFGARADEIGVVPGLAHDDMRQRLPQDHVGARLLAQPHLGKISQLNICLLYTSDAADERSSVDLGGRRIIKKKTLKTDTSL